MPSRPNSPQIAIQMTDLDIMERAALLLDSKVFSVKKRKPHWRQPYLILVRGSKAVALMKQFRPWMGERRKQQIDRALTGYNDIFKLKRDREFSPEEISEMLLLRVEGFSYRKISKLFDASHTTIAKVLGRSGSAATAPLL